MFVDPYVKVYFICDGCKSDKKKTQVKRRTLNPVYNETFHFTLPSHFEQRAPDSSSTSSFNNPPTNQVLLRFMIFDYDKVAKNEAIGKGFKQLLHESNNFQTNFIQLKHINCKTVIYF